MAESKSIFEQIQADLRKTGGGNWDDFFGLKPDTKCRIRFLKDFEECTAIKFHTLWEDDECKYNYPCWKHFDNIDEPCPQCHDKNKGARTQTHYFWPIYNYETKTVQVFGFKPARTTPIQALSAVYQENGTITNFDIVVERIGKGFDTKYTTSIIAKSVGDFTKPGIKPFSKKKILKLVYDANTDYGITDEDDEQDYDEEDVEIKTPPKRRGKPASKKKRPEPEEIDEDEYEDEEDEEEAPPPKRKAKSKSKPKRKPQYDDDDEDDDDIPFDIDEPEDADYYDDDEEEDEEELPPPRKRKRR